MGYNLRFSMLAAVLLAAACGGGTSLPGPASTLLTLLVIPTIHEILDGFRSWIIAKFWRRVIRTHPEAAPSTTSLQQSPRG